ARRRRRRRRRGRRRLRAVDEAVRAVERRLDEGRDRGEIDARRAVRRLLQVELVDRLLLACVFLEVVGELQAGLLAVALEDALDQRPALLRHVALAARDGRRRGERPRVVAAERGAVRVAEDLVVVG